MDIEAIVKKHLKRDGWSFSRDGECAEAIRAALTEAESCMAMEHNLKMLQVEAAHAIELRAYEATVANQAERIRQLEDDKAEYDRRIVAVGGVAINSVSREYHDAEVARLNALYESAVKGRQDFREAYRMQLEAERVPEGWKLVPIDPTDKMMSAGFKEEDDNMDCVAIYRAMLAAAPAKKDSRHD